MAAPTKWHCVTGCDSGFGDVVVKMLAEQGFGVFATHMLPDSAESLRMAHKNIVPLRVDITNQASVDAAVTAIEEKLGSIAKAELSGLVNNAGVLFQAGPVEWTPPQNYEAMLAVNVVGAVRMTNGLLPLLRRSRGRIVNVASMAGRITLPTQAAYCASKHAMEGYSDGLRRELWDWGVSVHIIEPGIFKKTGLYETYHTGTEKLWQGLPDHVKTAYGEKFRDDVGRKAGEALSKLGSTDNSLVPKAMIEALTSDRPRYRYQVGRDSSILVPLFGWLHESWQDWLLRGPGESRTLPAGAAADAYKANTYHNGNSFRNVVLSALAIGGAAKLRSRL